MVAGKTYAVGDVEFDLRDYVDTDTSFVVTGPDSAPVSGVTVHLQNADMPDWTYDLKTNASGIAKLPGKNGVAAGDYEITVVDPQLRFDPYSATVSILGTVSSVPVHLAAYVPLAFTAGPTVANADLAVGQTYTVAETTNRAALEGYEWFRDGKRIHGAVDTSYTSVGADVGHDLSVHVYAQADHLPTAVASVDVGTVEAGEQLASVSVPKITSADGLTHVDSVLHVQPGLWSESGVRLAYQWLLGGDPIDGATAATYTVTLADYESELPIAVRVIATKDGYPDSDPVTTAEVTSSVSPAAVPSAPFKITSSTKGVPKGATKFTVAPGKWSTTGLGFSYSWTIDGAEVSTTTSVVVPRTAPAGPVAVTVTATRTGYVDAAVTQVARKGKQAIIETAGAIVKDGETVTGALTLVEYTHTALRRRFRIRLGGPRRRAGRRRRPQRRGMPISGTGRSAARSRLRSPRRPGRHTRWGRPTSARSSR